MTERRDRTAMKRSSAGHDQRDVLRNQDLNQLIALDALLSQNSVTAAADVLGVSQPTMSKSLARLRNSFSDPLLVREGNVMHLTPFARDLALKLQETLKDLSDLYAPPGPFDPKEMKGSFRITCNDYVQAVLGAPLLKSLHVKAPSVKIEFRPLGMMYPEQLLVEGLTDIAITTSFPNINLHSAAVYSDPHICVAAADSTNVPDRLSLEDFLERSQIDVSPAGIGLLRQALARKHRQLKGERNVVATLTSFLALPAFLKGTDLLGVIPSRALSVIPPGSLKTIPLEFDLPAYDVSIWWHNQTNTDPFLRWVRSEISALGTTI